MEWSLAIVALAVLAVAAVSRLLSGTPITPAMVFVAVGLLVGPRVFGEVDVESSSSTVRTLAEATLALVLFCDASRVDLGLFRRELGLPVRLLGFGLPLTIVLGTVVAAVLLGPLSIEEALILAVVLAPTDAALGQAVVTDPRVPKPVRQGLNVESGLNDGICVPLLFVALALQDVESEISGGRALTLLVEAIGYGVAAGVIGGLVVGAVVIVGGRRRLIAGPWRPVVPAAGTALAVGVSTALGGSGFIAAFVAGLTFRLVLRRDPGELNDLNEQLGDVLSGVTFVLFGAILLGPALGDLTWTLVLHAVLSLTLVRMLPVAVALARSRARAPTVGFVGWFGPRGLASIVFAVILMEEADLPHEQLVETAIYLTVGLSVFVHGFSAPWLAHRYGRWFDRHPRDERPPMESAPAELTRPAGWDSRVWTADRRSQMPRE